ncbi:hypothetical protein GPALN_006180 [Globodera pallida]|nr:hypothetical protein GPALN_006180 [Globodera pallida]
MSMEELKKRAKAIGTFEELKKIIDIRGVNRYNPNNAPALERAVDLMIKETKYDKDIMMTLLKLYQLNPFLYNEKYVCLVLLKTMTNFPRNDFALAKYLVDANKVNTPELRRVCMVGALLESCNFFLFWRLVDGRYKPREAPDEPFKKPEEVRQMIESITSFKEATRNYACQVINVTFQRIHKQQLVNLLGGIDDAQLAAYANLPSNKWKKMEDADGNVIYFIHNHEEHVKSRNIEEKLRFEQYVEVLRSI